MGAEAVARCQISVWGPIRRVPTRSCVGAVITSPVRNAGKDVIART